MAERDTAASPDILRELNKGNEKALQKIYGLFFHALCAFGSNYIEEDAIVADIVQEVFIKVWERRKDFHAICSLRSFMYLSVRNACLNYNRDVSRCRHISLSGEIRMDELTEKEEEFVLEEEFYRLIQQEIDHLPEAVRKVFELTLLDKSIAEIAQLLQLSENTVRNQRARAREILRGRLKDKLFFYLFI